MHLRLCFYFSGVFWSIFHEKYAVLDITEIVSRHFLKLFLMGQHCGTASKATIYNAGIPYQCWFVSGLLHFWSCFLLLAWKRQWRTARVSGPQLSYRRLRWSSLTLGFDLAHFWPFKPAHGKYLSVCLFSLHNTFRTNLKNKKFDKEKSKKKSNLKLARPSSRRAE